VEAYHHHWEPPGPIFASLDVSANALTGSLPSLLGAAWTDFETFDVAGNDLTGTIPSSLASYWKKLGWAHFNNNSFVGSVPSGFCSNATATLMTALIADCEEATCACCTDCCSDATQCFDW
jgi:hypothetical protein